MSALAVLSQEYQAVDYLLRTPYSSESNVALAQEKKREKRKVAPF